MAAALVALMCVAAESAEGVECGKPATPGGAPVRGALALVDKPSTVTQAFGTDTGAQNLVLIFHVHGCKLPAKLPPAPVVVEALPNDDAPASFDTHIDTRTISLKRVSPGQLNVRIPVHSTFKPGTYGAIIQVSTSYLVPALTPVTVSRSEDNRF